MKLKLSTVLMTLMVMVIGQVSLAQSASDFWSAFDQCAQLTAFEDHYPETSGSSNLNLVVMDNGMPIPSNSGISFTNGIDFSVEDKGYILNNSLDHFFIIQDYKFTSTTAHFEVNYYYNFSGGYEHYVRASFELSNASGAWLVTSSNLL